MEFLRPLWCNFVVSVLICACAGLPSCTRSDERLEEYIGPLTAQQVAKLSEDQHRLPMPARTIDRTAGSDLPASGPLTLTLAEAVLTALGNNQALVVEKLNPEIARTFEAQERAVFDPILSADLSAARDRVSPETRSAASSSRASDVGGGAGVSAFLPTGTALSAGVTANRTWTDTRGEVNASRAGLTVTQALLRGFGTEVNLVNLRQARLDVLSSQYELRGFAEALVAEVERTYWQEVLARRRIEIVEDSLKLAEQQLNEIQERINVGKLAETELAAAQSEVALRKEDLINARSALQTTRLRMLRLLNPPGSTPWNREIVTTSPPEVPVLPEDSVGDHVAVAMRMRPELNQARLGVQRNDLEIVKTRNGLLPRMDLFISLGKSGYANSFGTSVKDLFEGDSFDALAGLSFELPPANRDARARHERATLTRRQSAEALANLSQLVEVDVRSAYIEVQRTQEQVAATAATRRFEEESLRAETEKFRVGKSTALLVARVQRDLLSARIAEVDAVVNYLTALVELYRLDGSLLARRQIGAPGAEPVAVNVPAP